MLLVGTLWTVSETQLKLASEWNVLCQVIGVSRMGFRHICIQGLKVCS